MKFFKTNKNKFIAIILVITSLSTLFAMTGNAYQMGGPQYYTESNVKKYRIYLWNEDSTNMSSSTPYINHADMERMNSSYEFAFVCASINMYNDVTYTWSDSEFDNLQFHLTHHEVYHRASTPNDEFSVSLICNSSRTSVTDDCIDRTLRDLDNYDGVIACAHVVVGSLNGPNDFYSVYAGGGINYSQSATFSYSASNIKHFSHSWQ